MRGIRAAVIIVGLLATLLAVGTVGFHILEGFGWFEAFYTTLMTVSTIGAGRENQLSETGQRFNVLLIFLGIVVVGLAIGSLTEAVIEFELGNFFGRRRMEKELSRLNDHIIICGSGRVGRKIALELKAQRIPMVIIEKESERAQWAQAMDIPVIVGDATSEATLRQARIDTARGLASAVTTDAQNVYIVLTARGIAAKLPIVARASEEDAEAKLLRAGATTVISPYSFAGQRMARVLTRPNVQRFIDMALSPLNAGELDLQIEEVRVNDPSKLAGLTIGEADLRHHLGVIILAIRRHDERLEFNPSPARAISAGDCLVAMGDSRKLKDLESLAGVSA